MVRYFGLILGMGVCIGLAVGSPGKWPESPGGRLCGVNCLYVAMLSLDIDPGDYVTFVKECGTIPPEGLSLGAMQGIADRHGLRTLLVSTGLDQLRERHQRFACIAHVNRDHFVLLTNISSGVVTVVDPPFERRIAAEVLAETWTGRALLLSSVPLEPIASPSSWGIPFATALGLAIAIGVLIWRRLRSST